MKKKTDFVDNASIVQFILCIFADADLLILQHT